MFDLDHFKKINDIHGHDAGDLVLKSIAAEVAPLPGVSGRLGGEEFALLTQNDLSDAFDIAQAFRQSVERLKIFAGDKPIAVTCSMGVAEWEAGDTIDILLGRADMALYEAKRTGRNKVVIADTFVYSEQHGQWQGASDQSLSVIRWSATGCRRPAQ